MGLDDGCSKRIINCLDRKYSIPVTFKCLSVNGINVLLFSIQSLPRTRLYLNGSSITSDSLGLDGSSNLIRLGSHFGNRYFDGLLDDVGIWGRPLDLAEVTRLWGNGMGDLGPNAKIEVDNIAWSRQISAKLVLNQPVNDFNATSDLDLNGLSLSSITEEVDSNGTIYSLIMTPDPTSPQLCL